MKARNIFAAVSAIALSITMCGCGESEEERAAEQAEMEQEKAEALLDLGVGDLPSGLSGSCSGDDENLASVRLDTMSQYLGVEIDNPYIDPTKDVLYSIILTSPESGQQTQVGIKMMPTGESLRFVNDMEGTNQKNYGPLGENDLTDTLLSTSIPDPAIQAGRTMEWHAILTVDGYDVATCPATGEAELK